MNGRVHAHITVSNRERTIAGHMEPGCRILTFGVVCIAVLGPDADLTDLDRHRAPDDRRKGTR